MNDIFSDHFSFKLWVLSIDVKMKAQPLRSAKAKISKGNKVTTLTLFASLIKFKNFEMAHKHKSYSFSTFSSEWKNSSLNEFITGMNIDD